MKYLILPLFVVLVLFSGCSQQPPAGPGGNAGAAPGGGLPGMPGEKSIDDFYYSGMATGSNDPSLCDRIEMPTERDDCYSQTASRENMDLSCAKITNPAGKDSCYIQVAQTSKDASVCEKAASMKQVCYTNVARATGNAAVCDGITVDTQRDMCVQELVPEEQRDAAFCEKLKSELVKNACFLSVAERTKDASVCNRIQNNTYKQGCLLNIQQ